MPDADGELRITVDLGGERRQLTRGLHVEDGATVRVDLAPDLRPRAAAAPRARLATHRARLSPMRARCTAPSSPDRPALFAAVAAAAAARRGARRLRLGQRHTARRAPAEPDAATCLKDLLVGGTSMTRRGAGLDGGHAGARDPDLRGRLRAARGPPRPRARGRAASSCCIARARCRRRRSASRSSCSSSAWTRTTSSTPPRRSWARSCPPVGMSTDRAEMIYLDAGQIGWADDTRSAAATIADGAYHKVRLTVAADGTAQVALDGNQVLSRRLHLERRDRGRRSDE